MHQLLNCEVQQECRKWPLLSDNDFEIQLENDTHEIAFNNLIEYVFNKFSNLEEGSSISFNLHIELDDNTLRNACYDTKLLVKLIVDKIKEGNRYNLM
ncbi:hypothetical protein F8M41_005664 [Gigaspora margarita]|uniref:Uncharacterized protein n=1 Tax=Gigaspora margarita TaxID=4874 RepID=A0A8H4A4S0_GIGMA|nr:hypothetical protein F8M41_005664 [Gigaspora margarita]